MRTHPAPLYLNLRSMYTPNTRQVLQASGSTVTVPLSAAGMENRLLGPHFLRTAWLFQAIVAGPIFFFLGIAAVLNMFNTYDTLSDFITQLCSSLLAGGIIYLVSIQRKLPDERNTAQLTLRFELAKAVLATSLWLWLLLDAIFARHYSGYASRTRRIIAAAISSLLLL